MVRVHVGEALIITMRREKRAALHSGSLGRRPRKNVRGSRSSSVRSASASNCKAPLIEESHPGGAREEAESARLVDEVDRSVALPGDEGVMGDAAAASTSKRCRGPTASRP